MECCYCAGRGQLVIHSDDPDESPYPAGVFIKLNVTDDDIDDDCDVDMQDFSTFAHCWQDTGCSSPDWCENSDIDQDGDVDLGDLADFAASWLQEPVLYGCQ